MAAAIGDRVQPSRKHGRGRICSTRPSGPFHHARLLDQVKSTFIGPTD